MKIEWWRYISGFVGLYMVSTFGRIKSFPRNGTVKKEKILKQRSDKYGYYYVIDRKSVV